MPVILISACLIGVRCTWRGAAAAPTVVERFQALLAEGAARRAIFLPICPEQLGGLPTPRPPAELQASATLILAGRGQVRTRDGHDCTAAYLRGAEEVRRLVRLIGAGLAVLRDRSPACGVRAIHAGFFTGALTAGRGVTAQALREEGTPLMTAEEFLAAWPPFGAGESSWGGWVYLD